MIDCLISFGSNLGDSRKIILEAIQSLESQRHVYQLKISNLISTRPIGGPQDQQTFVNGAARFETSLNPVQLLNVLHQTEKNFGRQRRIRWDARPLDLDLLLYGDEIRFDQGCEIPHPRMSFRQFVLVPAQSIAPDWVHPVCHATLDELLARISLARKTLIFSSKHRVDVLENQIEKFGEIKFCQIPDSGVHNLALENFSLESNAQLLVIDLINQSKMDFCSHNQELLEKHRGPLLLLENESLDRILVELAAASEAMKAI